MQPAVLVSHILVIFNFCATGRSSCSLGFTMYLPIARHQLQFSLERPGRQSPEARHSYSMMAIALLAIAAIAGGRRTWQEPSLFLDLFHLVVRKRQLFLLWKHNFVCDTACGRRAGCWHGCLSSLACSAQALSCLPSKVQRRVERS